jgi:hypothetical protein
MGHTVCHHNLVNHFITCFLQLTIFLLYVPAFGTGDEPALVPLLVI